MRSYRHIKQPYICDGGHKYGSVISSGMVVSLEYLEDVCQCTNNKIIDKSIETWEDQQEDDLMLIVTNKYPKCMVFQLHLEDLIVVYLVDMRIQYKEIFEKGAMK